MRITKPTLLVDAVKVRQNIRQMAGKAKQKNLIFRPHFKTHQSAEIGSWFREDGVNQITVSSVEMAEYFAQAGWNNITIAFPFNQLEMERINNLAGKIKLSILLIHPESVAFLKTHLTTKLTAFIKIDCGYQRSGIPAENLTEIEKLLNKMAEVDNLNFAGFLTHSGHTYQAASRKDILNIHQEVKKKMINLKNQFATQFPNLLLSLGDTPSCSLAEDFSGIDEIRPGNFVFYDVMQFKLGVCNPEQIAVALVCPIVSQNLQRNELVIYGGAVHLSKEFVLNPDGSRNFGLVVKLTESGWTLPLAGAFVTSLSQEHGIINMRRKDLANFEIGDLIGILPVHSCLTSNLTKARKILNKSLN